MSPRQFYTLSHRHKYQLQRESYLIGVLCSTIANYSFGGARSPLEPWDFGLPDLQRPVKPLPTDEELAEQIRRDTAPQR